MPAHTDPYSAQGILKRIHEKYKDIATFQEIENLINLFWGSRGIIKHLKGFKSFSINKMFFFPVYANKHSSHLNKIKRQRARIDRKAYNKKKRKKKRERRLKLLGKL